MKTLLFLTLTLLSFQTYSFESVTLKTEVKLAKNAPTSLLEFTMNEAKGSDYCMISLHSSENVDSLTLAAGTVFEVTSIAQNACNQDWGRQCRLDLEGYNQDKGVELYIVCKDRGLFASKFSESKVNQIAKNKISVK